VGLRGRGRGILVLLGMRIGLIDGIEREKGGKEGMGRFERFCSRGGGSASFEPGLEISLAEK